MIYADIRDKIKTGDMLLFRNQTPDARPRPVQYVRRIRDFHLLGGQSCTDNPSNAVGFGARRYSCVGFATVLCEE